MLMTVLCGTLLYEFRMQFRRHTIWLVLLLTSLPIFLLAISFFGFNRDSDQTDAHNAILIWSQFMGWFMPVSFGLLLADRLARDKKIQVDELFYTYPASQNARLFGKFLGSAIATLIPVFILYILGAGYCALHFQAPQLLPFSLLTFVTLLLPGLLFAAGFSVAFPAVIKVAIYQILFVGYWFWADLLVPRFHIPSLISTPLNATGAWTQMALFKFQVAPLVQGHPATWTGFLSMGLLLGLAFIPILLASFYMKLVQDRR